MANRRGGTIQVGEFEPKASPSLGTAAVARPDGSENKAFARSLGVLAEQAGEFADKAAAREGKAAGDTAGNDPKFRPDGGYTIRAQAYDAAGTSSYLNNLDAKVRSGVTDLYQKYQNDPNGLKTALDDFKAQMAKDDVFPEIASSFNSGFERLRLPFQVRALENMEERQRNDARASRLTAENAAATTIAQMAEANPGHPSTIDGYRTILSQNSAARRGAVARGEIKAQDAAQADIEDARNAFVRDYVNRGKQLKTPAELKNYIDEFGKSFSDNKLDPALDATGYDQAKAELQTLYKQKSSLDDHAVRTVKNRLDQIAQQAARGSPSSPDDVRDTKALLPETPQGDAIKRRFDKQILIGGEVETIGPAAMRAKADAIDAEAAKSGRGLTVEEAEDNKFRRDEADAEDKARASDPQAQARRRRRVSFPELSIDSRGDPTDSVARQIGVRVEAARTRQQQWGGAPTVLTNDDVAMIKTVTDAGGPRAVAMLEGIVRGAGDASGTVLAQLGGTMPELARAGQILREGGPQARTTATKVMQALALKDVKGAPALSVPKNARDIAKSEFGVAFDHAPELYEQIMATAGLLYARDAQGKITDNKSPEADTLFRQSLHVAAGMNRQGNDRFGGVGDYKVSWNWNSRKVVVPTEVRSDMMRPLIGGLRDEDLGGATDPNGTPIRARDLQGAFPQRAAGGYVFYLDDPASDGARVISTETGAFVLNLDALAPKLRQRVPGAYLGNPRRYDSSHEIGAEP